MNRISRPVFVLLSLGAIVVGGALAMSVSGRSEGARLAEANRQLEAARKEVAALRSERDQVAATLAATQSQLNIERSAQKQLALQAQRLEVENARIKEDLAFFDRVLPTVTGPRSLVIRRFRVELISPGQLRYRLLVVQGDQREQPFNGSLQIAVSTLRDGKSAMMIFPENNSSGLDPGFKLSFKHYQRVEGVLTLPDGLSVQTVEARVLEKGQIRAQQSAHL